MTGSSLEVTGTSYVAGLERDPRPLLVGRYCQPVIAETAVHAECLAAYESTSLLLESLGHRVVDIDVPFPLSAVPHFARVWADSLPLKAEESQAAAARHPQEEPVPEEDSRAEEVPSGPVSAS